MMRAIFFAAIISSCLSQNLFASRHGSTHSNGISFQLNPKFQRNNLGSSRFVAGNNIFDKTRRQANTLKSTLRNLAVNQKASRYMKKIFLSGDCVQSVEEAIMAIESGVAIIESAEPSLRRLMSSLRTINDNSNLVDVTKTSANILRQMENLIPQLAPSDSSICGSTFDVAYKTLQAVGDILFEVSEDRSLGLSKITQLDLKISREIVNSVNTFTGKLRDIFSDLKTQCTTHQGYNIRSMEAIGRMLDGLADLFRNLGDNQGEQEIREKTVLTKKLSGAIENFPEVESDSIDCNSSGDFETTARMLEDLAKLIDEIGIDKLKQQLGVNEFF